MLQRRIIAGVAGILLMVAGMGTASAQESSPTVPETTTTSVLGTSTTTEPEETTTTEVEPEEVISTTTTTEAAVVAGDVVRRPLPRTGNDIGGTAIFGGALTILGVGLALTARKRRNSFDGV